MILRKVAKSEVQKFVLLLKSKICVRKEENRKEMLNKCPNLLTADADMTLGSRQTEVGLATRAMVPLPPRTAESDADCPPLSEELLP